MLRNTTKISKYEPTSPFYKDVSNGALAELGWVDKSRPIICQNSAGLAHGFS